MRESVSKENVRRELLAAFKVVLGSFIYAVGFQFFMYPNDIVTGGLTGIAMIINYLTRLPVGVLTIIMNIPLFLYSWKRFGLRFIAYSLASMLLCSAFVDLLAQVPVEMTKEPLLGAIYGGVIHGLGMGIVFQTGATTGGLDIVAKLLRKRYQHINIGTIIMGLDLFVIALFAVIFRLYDRAMYALICMFCTTKVVDVVLYGAINSKVCYIITDEHERVKDAITRELDRGVTFLHGEGAWSRKEKDIILCVIKQRQIVELKTLVRAIDESAFMIVSDSREVFGKGFSSYNSD
ncbi:MAG: YitT family protein [Oscillospiraceae bacterium]|nr:YitT family protein [Oscillospiraceae bacterium]